MCGFDDSSEDVEEDADDNDDEDEDEDSSVDDTTPAAVISDNSRDLSYYRLVAVVL